MIIEFLAPPATGKSYVSKILVKKLQKLGIKCELTNERFYKANSRVVWRSKKLLYIFFLLIRRPISIKLILLILVEPISWKDRISTIYNSLSVLSINSIESGNIQIRDEGIFQLIFALKLFGIEKTDRYLETFKKLIIQPHILIVLNQEQSILINLKHQGRKGRIFQKLNRGVLTEKVIKEAIDKTFEIECDNLVKLSISYNKDKSDVRIYIEKILSVIIPKSGFESG